MRVSFLAFSVAVCVTGYVSGSKQKSTRVVPNSYIIEFERQPVDSLSVVHAEFHQHLQNVASKGYSTRFEWNSPDVMVGMSVVLDSPDDKQWLARGPGVKSVYPNTIIDRPAGSLHMHNDHRLQRRDDVDADMVHLKDTFPSHVITAVDVVHAQGMYGKGQTVAIVDDGISAHPALDDRFGENKGWAFVGDDFNANNANTLHLAPGPDPYTKCATHGTHIAGIVAANDTRLGFTGVAPQANLRAYRIAGCTGSTTSDLIIAAFEKAYSDGNDIITLSWDTGADSELSPASIVASRINANGVAVVLAVGNKGYLGMYGADDAALGVTSVGAVSNPTQPGFTAQVVGSSPAKSIRFFSAYWVQWNTSSVFEIYDLKSDGCKPFDGPDLRDKIVLVAQAACPVADVFRNVYSHNAKFVWLYSSVPTSATFDLDAITTSLPGLQTALIPRDDALWLKAQKRPVSIDFAKAGRAEYPDPLYGNRIVSVSGLGPSIWNNINPSILAPGGDILSTYPAEDGSYSVWWGTSMAAPFIAGSYAVYRSVHPGVNVPTMQNVFASTATPYTNGSQSNFTGPEYIDTVAKQGAGLVNVARAVFQQVVVDPAYLALNDTSHFNGTHTITLSNTSPVPVSYEIVHIPAATADAVNSTTPVLNVTPVPLHLDPAHVEFSASSITVPAHGQARFTAKFTPPSHANAAKIPIFSGYIHLEAIHSKQSLNVIYLGVAADYTKIDPIDRSDVVLGYTLPTLMEADQKTIIHESGHVYSMSNSSDWPCMLFRLNFFTPFYRIDLVAPDTAWTETTRFSDVKVFGNIDYSSAGVAPHSANNNNYGGAFITEIITPVLTPGPPPDTDNVTVVPGQYQFLVRAQRPFTDGVLMRDYSTWASHSFSLVAATK